MMASTDITSMPAPDLPHVAMAAEPTQLSRQQHSKTKLKMPQAQRGLAYPQQPLMPGAICTCPMCQSLWYSNSEQSPVEQPWFGHILSPHSSPRFPSKQSPMLRASPSVQGSPRFMPKSSHPRSGSSTPSMVPSPVFNKTPSFPNYINGFPSSSLTIPTPKSIYSATDYNYPHTSDYSYQAFNSPQQQPDSLKDSISGAASNVNETPSVPLMLFQTLPTNGIPTASFSGYYVQASPTDGSLSLWNPLQRRSLKPNTRKYTTQTYRSKNHLRQQSHSDGTGIDLLLRAAAQIELTCSDYSSDDNENEVLSPLKKSRVNKDAETTQMKIIDEPLSCPPTPPNSPKRSLSWNERLSSREMYRLVSSMSFAELRGKLKRLKKHARMH
ncbi:hypothetical protein HDU76_004674 [Blyttiomyces sp. JEL0837]|nr:hypothetical protein HDU76_004674 [Blyttiomyces sp. JEL0837]